MVLSNRPKIKISRDHALATADAILFRIEQIKKECGNVLTPAAYSRIDALRARLPKDPNAPLAPAIDPNLLVSKSQIDEYGKAPSLYA
jgi:hypothetical protein